MTLAKAIQILSFGGPEVLQLREIPIPSVGKGQVLVRLFAAGVNPVETYIRAGTYASMKPPLPYIPGSDGAGVIQTVGAGVSNFKEGDRVFFHGKGTYAQFSVCDEAIVHKLHPNFTFSQGTALGVPYLTAYRALFHRLKVKQNETLFIHGASGGVGVAAIQFAKDHGMTVLGTAGTAEGEKVVMDAGAHKVFNHREKGYLEKVMAATDNRGADVILEVLANVNLDHDLDLVADNGRIAIVGSRGTVEIDPRKILMKECSVTGVAFRKSTQAEIAEGLAKINQGAEEGWLCPVVGKTFKLADASEAHKEIIHGSATGKLVLEID